MDSVCDILQLHEVTKKVVLNKMRLQEVCFKGVCEFLRMRMALMWNVYTRNFKLIFESKQNLFARKRMELFVYLILI